MPDVTKTEDYAVDSTDQRTLSEIEMDAQDVTPQAIRRGRSVVGVILILAVIAITVIIITPPLSWKPAGKVSANYVLPQPAANVVQGDQPYIRLQYAPVSETQVYHLEIQQNNDGACEPAEDGCTGSARVTLKTDVLMEGSKHHQSEHALSFSLKNVDVHVFDNDREIPLASVDDMIGNNKGDGKKGVRIFSHLDPVRGMGSVEPDANVNPQIARVLVVVADSIRQVYQPLPELETGNGASWQINGMNGDNVPEDENLREKRNVSMTLNGDVVTLNSEISLSRSQDDIVGTGESIVTMKDGRVIRADINMHRKSPVINMQPSNRSKVSIHWEMAER